jgi:anti-anti-sigma regulatory factor
MSSEHLAPTPGRTTIVPGVTDLAVISVPGNLDDATAARLLRWCEARLHLVEAGQATISHLVIDLSHARQASPSALAILAHARTEAQRRMVGIHLVVSGAMMTAPSLQARRHLLPWNSFPTLDAARAALTQPTGQGSDHTSHPVDPDAIMLTPIIHDRLG